MYKDFKGLLTQRREGEIVRHNNVANIVSPSFAVDDFILVCKAANRSHYRRSNGAVTAELLPYMTRSSTASLPSLILRQIEFTLRVSSTMSTHSVTLRFSKPFKTWLTRLSLVKTLLPELLNSGTLRMVCFSGCLERTFQRTRLDVTIRKRSLHWNSRQSYAVHFHKQELNPCHLIQAPARHLYLSTLDFLTRVFMRRCYQQVPRVESADQKR